MLAALLGAWQLCAQQIPAKDPGPPVKYPGGLPLTSAASDCRNAIPVCQATYVQNTPPLGKGQIIDLQSQTTCLTEGEKNSVWYIFTVLSPGSFGFTITTNGIKQIDYDFVLYNLTTASCLDISTGQLQPVRCNYSSFIEPTGLNPNATQPGNLSYTATGAPMMPGLQVQTGQTYVLMVDRFSNEPLGYTIQFSGTASIFDTAPPTVVSGTPLCPSSTRAVTVTFSEPVSCASVSVNDFQWVVGNQTFAPASVTCGPGSFDNTIDVFAPAGMPLTASTTLRVVSPVSDLCGNNLVVPVATNQSWLAITGLSRQDVACHGGATGRITVTASGSGLSYALNGGTPQPSGLFTGLTAGSYEVQIQDAAGCTVTQPVTLTEPPVPLTVSLSATRPACATDATGTLTVSTSGSFTGALSYLWSTGSTLPALANLLPGTYGVTVTDANGCSQTATQVLEPLSPGFTVQVAVANVQCRGQATGAISLNISGGQTPFQYQWSTGAQTRDVALLPAATYSVTVTDGSGCSQTLTAEVKEPASPLNVTVQAKPVTCFELSNGTLTTLASGGTSPYTYAWAHGPTTANLANLPPNTYTVVVTDRNGCQQTASAVVTAPAQALAVSIQVSQITCKGSADGSLTANPTGGSPPYQYLWNTGATTPGLTGLGPGARTVTITDANGCTASASATLTEPAQALTVSTTAQPVQCAVQRGSITTTVQGGQGPYQFVWSNGATTQNLANLNAGIYTLTLTDARGCVRTVSQPVAQVNPPVVQLTAQAVSCFGGEDGSVVPDITGIGPFTYLWSTAQTEPLITGLKAGTYTLTITDQTGCTATAQAEVEEPETVLAFSAQTQHPTCFGASDGSIAVSVVGGAPPYEYEWSTGAQTPALQNLPAGNYDLLVTDASGCKGTYAVQLTQPPQQMFVSVVVQHPGCANTANGRLQAQVTGGTPPYSYSWASGQTTPNLVNQPAGTYTLTVRDAQGCRTTATATLVAPAGLSVGAGITNVPCANTPTGSIQTHVSGGTAPYTYLWDNGTIQPDLTNLVADDYTVLVTDANGCTARQTFTVVAPNALKLTLVPTPVRCFGAATGSIQTTTSGGTAPLVYSWSTGAVTRNLSGVAAGTYTLTATDANGCAVTQTAVVDQPAQPVQVLEDITTLICKGDANGRIRLTVSGGTAPYRVTWNGTTDTATMVPNLPAGSYTYTVTDFNNCTLTRTVVLSEPAQPLTVNAQLQAPACPGGNEGSIIPTVSGGEPPYAIVWSDTTYTGLARTQLPAGTYRLRVTDARGCSLDTVFTLAGLPPFADRATIQYIRCHNDTNGEIHPDLAGGVPPYSFGWSDGVGVLSRTQLPAGTYTLTGTDSRGCPFSFTYTLPNPPPLGVSLWSQGVACKGEASGSIFSTATGGTQPYQYLWSNGATTKDVKGVPIGYYTVVVTDTNGCVVSSGIEVVEADLVLDVVGSVNHVLCKGKATGSISVTIVGGNAPYQYKWADGSLALNRSGLVVGTYQFTVIDANTCFKIIPFTVTEPPALAYSIRNRQDVSCSGGSDGAVELTASGGVPPYQLTWNDGATGFSRSALAAGTLMGTLTDANGCSTSVSVSITQPPPLTATYTVVPVACFGQSTGRITVSPSGGTPPYSYTWSTGASTPDLLNQPAGTYSLTVQDAKGCTSTANIPITQPSAPLNLTVTTDSVVCAGTATGQLNPVVTGGTPPYTYAWSDGSSLGTRPNVVAGLYSLTVTDANGCTVSQTVSVLSPPPLVVQLSTQGVACSGQLTGSITSTVSGGILPYTFSWADAPHLTTPTRQQLAAGFYTLTVTDANGCQKTLATQVAAPAPLAVTLVPKHIRCPGQADGQLTAQVSGGVPPYQTVWSTGASNTLTLTGLPAQDYLLSVTDANGCTASAAQALTQPTELLLHLDTLQPVACHGESTGRIQVTASGGTPPYLYALGNGLPNATGVFPGLPTGTYTIRLTDANGCTQTLEASVLQPTLPLELLVLEVNPIPCAGQAVGLIRLRGQGGTPPYSHSFDGGQTWLPDSVRSQLPGGLYTCVLKDAQGCLVQRAVRIVEPEVLVALAEVSDQRCADLAEGGIRLRAQGGTPPFEYRITGFAWQADPLFAQLTEGLYTGYIRDANGCLTQTAPLSVTEPALLRIDSLVVTGAGCVGEATGSIEVLVSGGTPPYTYRWPDEGLTTPDSIRTRLMGGVYRLVVADSRGCQTPGLSILVPQKSAVDARADTQLCVVRGQSQAFTLPAGIPPGGTWSGPGIVPATEVFSSSLVSGAGSWPLVYTYDGCTDTLMVHIVELAIPLDTVSICANADPFPLPAMPLLGFWATSHPESPSPHYLDRQFDPRDHAVGHQTVYYRAQQSGCVDSFTVRILPAPHGEVFANHQPLTADTLYVQFPAVQVAHAARYAFADSLAWFLGALDPEPLSTDTAWIYSYLQDGVYRLELRTANRFSCTDRRVFWVVVRDSTGIEVPTAFSPNNDGLNDAFEIKALNLLWHQVTIFSRWAGAIHTYRAEGGYSSWNGQLSDGSPVPEGTYGCRVSALKHDGRTLEWVGFVHVLR